MVATSQVATEHSVQQSEGTVRRVVSLVCVAHFFSHFYLLLLPPLFPVLSTELNIGYTELGFSMTAFSLLSGLTQVPMGFIVDRYGPNRILVAGIALQGLAIALIGVFPVYSIFLALLGIAGIANSVYHPADYSILNRVVSGERIGRAFSFHTASGLFGEAVAPVTILLLASLFGWKIGLAVCGVLGLITALLLGLNARSFENDIQNDGRTASYNTASDNRLAGTKLLFTAPILMGLAFFACISIMNRGITGFSVSAMHLDSGMSVTTAGALLSAWLFASPLGVLVGGQLADRTKRHTLIIASLFVIIAIMIMAIATIDSTIFVTGALFAVAGFCAGAVSPSRDMLIRSMTPPGQTGKVFGFVSTGFNIGGIIAPPVYGYVLDNSRPDSVFWIAAFASLLTIVTVTGTGFLKLKRSTTNRSDS